jgi:hypothetical protein
MVFLPEVGEPCLEARKGCMEELTFSSRGIPIQGEEKGERRKGTLPLRTTTHLGR